MQSRRLETSNKSRSGQTCNGSSEQRERKIKIQRQCQKQLRQRRLHPLDHNRPNFILRSMRIRAWPEQEKQREGDDLVHLLQQAQPHRNSKGDGKGGADGGAEGSIPKLTGKSPSGKANRLLCTNSTKKVAKGDIHVVIGMFANVQNSKLQVDADSETSVHTNSLQNLLWKRTIQHRSRFTFHRMMNDRCNYRKVSWMTGDPITREPTLGVAQTGSQNQRKPNAPTLEGRSIEWTLRMEDMARTSVWTWHMNVYDIPGS